MTSIPRTNSGAPAPLRRAVAIAAVLLSLQVALAQAQDRPPPPPPPGGQPPPGAGGPPPPPFDQQPRQPQQAPMPPRTEQPAPTSAPPAPASSPAPTAPDVDEAADALQRARSEGDPAVLARALLTFADARVQAGRQADAISALTEAAEIAARTGDDVTGREASLAAVDIYEAQRDPELADAWRQRADAFRERIRSGLPSVDVSLPATSAAAHGAPVATGAAIDGAGDGYDDQRAPLWPWAIVAGTLAVLWAWVRSRRRIASLDEETERLSRHQRHLSSAHKELQRQAEHLRQTATQDALTGALTRSAFAHSLDLMLQHAARFGHPVALFVFDLDHFKAINDGHGHLAGDAALKLVVGVTREKLDSDDLLGRFGGDEFLVACRRGSTEEFLPLAESLREAVRRRVANDPALSPLSLSLGIAVAAPATGYALEPLFAQADAALYAAKRAGRNKCVLASELTPVSPDGSPLRSLAGG